MKIICFKIRQCRKTNYKRKYEKNIKKGEKHGGK